MRRYPEGRARAAATTRASRPCARGAGEHVVASANSFREDLAVRKAVALLTVALFVASGCAMRQKKTLEKLEDPPPIDCETAEGDLRVLTSEKAHVWERIAEGVTSIVPAGAVLGIITWTEPTKIKVAIGTYNDAIEKRIGEIKEECNLE